VLLFFLFFLPVFTSPAKAQEVRYSPLRKIATFPGKFSEWGKTSGSIIGIFEENGEIFILWYKYPSHLYQLDFSSTVFLYRYDGKNFTQIRRRTLPSLIPSCVVENEGKYFVIGFPVKWTTRFRNLVHGMEVPRGLSWLMERFNEITKPEPVLVTLSFDHFLKSIKRLAPLDLRGILSQNEFLMGVDGTCGILPDGSLYFQIFGEGRIFSYDASAMRWNPFTLPEGIAGFLSSFLRASDGYYYALVAKKEGVPFLWKFPFLARFSLSDNTINFTGWEIPYKFFPYEAFILSPLMKEIQPGLIMMAFGSSPGIFGSVWTADLKRKVAYTIDATDFAFYAKREKFPSEIGIGVNSGKKLYAIFDNALYQYDVSQAPWKWIAFLGSPRIFPASALIQDQLFIAGGETGGVPVASVEVVAVSSGEVRELPPMKEARAGACGLVYRDSPVILGGRNILPLSSVERWNWERNRWENFPPLNVARAYPACVEHQGKIWLFGGLGKNGPVSTYEVYTSERGWKIEGNLPEALYYASAVSTPAGIVVAGGKRKDGSVSSAVYLLPSGKSQWEEMPAMNSPRSGFCLRALPDGTLIALFGWDGDKTSNTFEVLTPGASQWEEFRYTVYPRYGVTCEVQNNRILFAGGMAQVLGPANLVDSFFYTGFPLK
ncbi:MAG: Kelch repeat-containing protein, partial [bacterium]